MFFANNSRTGIFEVMVPKRFQLPRNYETPRIWPKHTHMLNLINIGPRFWAVEHGRHHSKLQLRSQNGYIHKNLTSHNFLDVKGSKSVIS